MTTEVLIDNLVFPECPRWHNGALWFCDVNGHKIIEARPNAPPRVVLEHDQQPAGLGWLPDGTLVFVSMLDRKLICVVDGGKGTLADLSEHEPVSLNDMCVDARGNAYIGGFGFDLNRGAKPAPGNIYRVTADSTASDDGTVSIAATDMMFANGIVITDDGRTLVAAETVARRLTAFDIADDGALTNRRVWAQLEAFPDGICLDAEGAIWVSSPPTSTFLRVREGGEVTDRIPLPDGKWAVACMLGGEDGRTLYLCTAKTTLPELAEGKSVGWIETVRVDVGRGGALP